VGAGFEGGDGLIFLDGAGDDDKGQVSALARSSARASSAPNPGTA